MAAKENKADLIGGFNESFEALGAEERAQVWGFTFDDAAATAADPLPGLRTLATTPETARIEPGRGDGYVP